MKLKRLLTGVLSAVMALSVCAMPAMAADDNNAAAAPKTGSLTITKYERPKDVEKEDWSVKDKGNPLAGVTFTVYKVAEVNQTVDANGDVSFDYDLVTELKGKIEINWEDCLTADRKQYDSAKLFSAFNTALTANSKKLSDWSLFSKPQTTNEQGVAKFENLATGVYMVEETSAPTQITSKTANFMVSIPMTVTKENGTQEITYNVNAEPKNVSTYGGVTLNKYGQVAGDNKTKARIADAVFQLYRNNGSESTPKWEPVDLTAKGIKVDNVVVADENAKAGKVTTTVDGVNITGLTPGNYYFKEISAPAGYIADTKTEHKFKLDDNGDVWVNNAKVDDRVVEVVNEKPDFEKTVAERGATTSASNHDADYGIGDLVPYTLTVKVPSTIENMKTFYVTDTVDPAQLEHQNTADNSVVVKVGNEVLSSDYYTVNIANGTMTVDFKAGNTKLGKNYADKTITIEYKAKLLDGAGTTKEGNINTAELIYSNKTSTDASVEPETDKNTIHDESVVYTFKTSIHKTGANGAGALEHVKFDLYKALTTEDYTGDTVPTEVTFMGTKHQVVTAEASEAMGFEDTANLIKVTSEETDSKGNITVSGLPAGTYYWVETETLPGYNLLTKPVKADLSVAYEAAWKSVETYEGNKLTHREYDATNTTYTDANTVNNKVTNVVNRKGFTLPVTGGFGTLLFSGIGVLLVLAGVCVLFSMKKKNNRA